MTLPLVVALRNAAAPHDNLTFIAADEIARLRAELQITIICNDACHVEIADLRASNAGLLAALKVAQQWMPVTAMTPLAMSDCKTVAVAIEKAEGHD